jgi:ABC-type lipoprotein export system ATPase subunit/GNAT superfamily N-acetyltransferase
MAEIEEIKRMDSVSNVFRISNISRVGHLKRVHLEPGNHLLDVPLSSCVGKGDQVIITLNGAWVICKNGQAQFLDPYINRDILFLGSLKLEVVVKEITEQDEQEAYDSLSEFHYRGHVVHGRTARLVMRTFDPSYPKVIGFIELATPFYMNKARSTILDSPFSFGEIAWQKWDIPTIQKYINVLVRVARVVVYPEFRGFGVGQMLVKHATEFAKGRWQIAGYKPYFLEISADMIKYVPFAQHAGMTFVGETQGNLGRVAKDMKYLMSRFGTDHSGQVAFSDTCGICDQQITRMTGALQVMKREGLTQEYLIQRLGALSKEKVLKDFALFHKVVTLPKPHYMLGLNSTAQNFIKGRVSALLIQNGQIAPTIKVEPIVQPIRLNNVSITYISNIRRTQKTHAVEQAFGISPEELKNTVVRDLNVVVPAGAIVLVVGPSGSGKTSLLDALLDKGENRSNMHIEGSIEMPENFKIGGFKSIRSQKTLIDILGGKDVNFGLYLLGLAGLSEAFLYLKRFRELSAGQKYRAMLAQLLASECNIWIADEFCANLDPITANMVGYSVQRIARKVRATVILGASHCDHFVYSLKPDLVLQLSSAWEHLLFPGDKYCSIISKNQIKTGRVPSIKVSNDFIDAVRRGKKTVVVCSGRREFGNKLLMLENEGTYLWVRIDGIEYKITDQLTDKDAQDIGEPSVHALVGTLQRKITRAKEPSILTIVHFNVLTNYLRGDQ